MIETPQERVSRWLKNPLVDLADTEIREAIRAVLAEVERCDEALTAEAARSFTLEARAERAEAALTQIAAWSWDSGSTPAPEVVSRIYCEARAALRDTAPAKEGKP
jgi:hypothetical protein